MNNRLACDICNNEFILEAHNIQTKIIDNVEIIYFECRHCSYKYITTCIDDYIRKEQRRYQKLIKDIDNVDKTHKCLNNMKLHSDRLKIKFLGNI
ncbi:MAG: hypothetical protein ACRDD7_13035 [Peptostreptococcaceae bacterium]